MVQVRDVPDDVPAELWRRAAASGMSLSEFIKRELLRMARRPSLAEVLDRAARRPGEPLTFGEAREAVTAERPGG